ncbi:MAG: hypothetical protein WA110_02110 [Anaerolineaceae bacterium]
MDGHRLPGAFTGFPGLRFTVRLNETRKVGGMLIRIGLEHGVEGRTLAWALDFPGCFAYGLDDAEVLIRIAHNLVKHEVWVNLHTDTPWFVLEELDFRTVEVWDTFTTETSVGAYEVNAWFKDDQRLVSPSEVEQALLLHHWQREELLAGVESLPPEILKVIFPGQRWDILGILRHVARVEYWYLRNLDLTLPPLPEGDDPVELLAFTEELVRENLPAFAGNPTASGHQGESWSCRKVVRRLLWHQRDHIDHIRQLVLPPSA